MSLLLGLRIYLGYLDDQNLTLHDSLLTSVPSDQLTFVVPRPNWPFVHPRLGVGGVEKPGSAFERQGILRLPLLPFEVT